MLEAAVLAWAASFVVAAALLGLAVVGQRLAALVRALRPAPSAEVGAPAAPLPSVHEPIVLRVPAQPTAARRAAV